MSSLYSAAVANDQSPTDAEKAKLVSRILWLEKHINQDHRSHDEHGLKQCHLDLLQTIYDHCQAMYDEEQACEAGAETNSYTNGHDNTDKQYHKDQISKRTQQKGYTRHMVSNWGYYQEDKLNTNERMMVNVLLRFGWNAGRCTVYQATIATDMGCSISTVYRTQQSLIKKGWLAVIEKFADKSTYQILKKEIVPPRHQNSTRH